MFPATICFKSVYLSDEIARALTDSHAALSIVNTDPY